MKAETLTCKYLTILYFIALQNYQYITSELCKVFTGIRFKFSKLKFHIYSFDYIIINMKKSSMLYTGG